MAAPEGVSQTIWSGVLGRGSRPVPANTCFSRMFARGILTLCLAAGLVAPFRLAALPIAQTRLVSERLGAETPLRSTKLARHAVTTASARHSRRTPPRHAAARAVERRLLLVASRTHLLGRFVDRATGLVKRNVTAHCKLVHRRQGRRHSVYLCQVWQHPRPPSSGARVLCRDSHKRFVVMAYRRA